MCKTCIFYVRACFCWVHTQPWGCWITVVVDSAEAVGPVVLPLAKQESSGCSMPLPVFGIVFFLHCTHSGGYEVILYCGLNLPFHDADHLGILFCEVPVQVSCLFFLLDCRSFSYWFIGSSSYPVEAMNCTYLLPSTTFGVCILSDLVEVNPRESIRVICSTLHGNLSLLVVLKLGLRPVIAHLQRRSCSVGCVGSTRDS